MSAARNVQLLRILGMIRDLSAARTGVAIQDLRDRYGVTRRTIERDLQAIADAGYTVESLNDPEPGKIRKRILAGSGGLNLPVTATELAAARAGIKALEREAPASITASLKMLVNRLEETQTMAVTVDADALAEAQSFLPRPGAIPIADAAVLDTLKTAILRCERLSITYRKEGVGPAREYLAEPYGLLYGAKSYLVWRGVEDRKWRKFALPHMDRAEPTGETFERAPSFNIAEFAADGFGVYRDEPFEVVLRVLPEGMGRLSHHSFHPSQTVEPTPNGEAIVRFMAGGLLEICWHLFTWGNAVQVKEPKELIAAYTSLLDQAQHSLA